MNIDWRLKSLLFRAVDRFEAAPVLYFLQKHVTGRSRVRIARPHRNWLWHRDALATLTQPRVLEFGAGKNLAQNLFLSDICAAQVLIDLNPMADLAQIRDAATQLARIVPGFTAARLDSLADLEPAYRIRYIAPMDAAATPFDDASFDACISTNTLEHVPEPAIRAIFTELRRILRPGGIVSARISYADHYAHTDRRIGALNYLRFDAADWARHNHRAHFQNRLRHSDYARIFTALGFRIARDVPVFTDAPLPDRIAPCFDPADPTLAATGGFFVLRAP